MSKIEEDPPQTPPSMEGLCGPREDKDENEKMTNMKKKEYMIPTCEVVELEMVNMIATSPEFKPGTDLPENDWEDMSNRHRGEWGNLWN